MEQSCVEQRTDRQSSEGGFGLVEVLVALIVLSVGLLGVGGLALVASQHTERASSRTGQELAAQRVIEGLLEQGYAGLTDETGAGPMDTTITVKGQSYTVTKQVEQVSFRVRRILAEVEGTTFTDPITRTTRIAEP